MDSETISFDKTIYPIKPICKMLKSSFRFVSRFRRPYSLLPIQHKFNHHKKHILISSTVVLFATQKQNAEEPSTDDEKLLKEITLEKPPPKNASIIIRIIEIIVNVIVTIISCILLFRLGYRAPNNFVKFLNEKVRSYRNIFYWGIVSTLLKYIQLRLFMQSTNAVINNAVLMNVAFQRIFDKYFEEDKVLEPKLLPLLKPTIGISGKEAQNYFKGGEALMNLWFWIKDHKAILMGV